MKRLEYYQPNLASSWILVFFLVAGSLVFGVLINLIDFVFPSPVFRSQTLSYLLTMICPLTYALIMGGKYRSSGAPAVKINNCRFGRYGAVPFFFAIAIGLPALSALAEPISNLLPMPELIRQLFETVFKDSALWDSIVATCILAPLLEELLCRGLMMRGMMRTMAPWKAILWSAFLFAFMHLNPWQAIPAFIFGCFFGWIYWKSGCLWATVLLHCINNTLSTLLVRLMPEVGVDSGLKDILPAGAYPFVYGGCLIVFILVCLFLIRNFNEKTISA